MDSVALTSLCLQLKPRYGAICFNPFPYVCAVIAFVDAQDYHVTQDEITTYVDKYKSKYSVPSVVKEVKKR